MSRRMRIRQTRTSPGVPRHGRPTDDNGVASTERRDRGVSLVEMLVAVTLMGTVVVAVVASVGVTVKATAYERDHAKAQQWLQAAVGVIEAVDFSSCDPLGDQRHQRAEGLPGCGDRRTGRHQRRRSREQLTTVRGDLGSTRACSPCRFPTCGTARSSCRSATSSVCYDQSRLRQQRVRLVVNHPSGVEETVEMIKVDR